MRTLSYEHLSLCRESRENVATEIDDSDLSTELEHFSNRVHRLNIEDFATIRCRLEEALETFINRFSKIGIARFFLPNTELLAQGFVLKQVMVGLVELRYEAVPLH